MTRDPDDLTRALDLLWLRAELAALPEGAAADSPVAGLRTHARRALLKAQTEGKDAPSGKDLDRLIVLLVIDRLWRTGGRLVLDMDSTRLHVELDAHADQPYPFTLRFDVTRPGGAEEDTGSGP